MFELYTGALQTGTANHFVVEHRIVWCELFRVFCACARKQTLVYFSEYLKDKTPEQLAEQLSDVGEWQYGFEMDGCQFIVHCNLVLASQISQDTGMNSLLRSFLIFEC